MGALTGTRILGYAPRPLLVAAFGIAGGYKVVDPLSFRAALHHYGFGTEPLATVVAALVPSVELVGAILLAVGAWTRVAASALGLMLIAFTGVSLWGNPGTCGCFPFPEPSSPWWLVSRNALLLACCVLLLKKPRPQSSCH